VHDAPAARDFCLDGVLDDLAMRTPPARENPLALLFRQRLGESRPDAPIRRRAIRFDEQSAPSHCVQRPPELAFTAPRER
jgi:hypothetical protein